MADLIYREQEGRELLNAEIDGNFRALDNAKTENTETAAIDLRLQSAENTIASQGNALTDHDARLDAAEQQIGGQQVELADLNSRLDIVEPTLEGVVNLAEGTQLALEAHQAAQDPHSQYALDSDLQAHAAAPDPHPTYLTQVEADIRYDPIGSGLQSACAIEVFGVSGTYTKPLGAKSMHLLLIGGGHGGGSGMAGGNRIGGSGGGGGARLEFTLEASEFPNSCAVIVGTGGAGAPPGTSNFVTQGDPGSDSSIDVAGVIYTASGCPASGTTSGLFPGGASIAGAGIAGPLGNPGAGGAPGGGAGAGRASGNNNGGAGAFSLLHHPADVRPIDSAGIYPSGDAFDVPDHPEYSKFKYPGISGGGGGGGSVSANGGKGGDGGNYGAGGGGGGAAEAGFISGGGGKGGDGVVVITTYF